MSIKLQQSENGGNTKKKATIVSKSDGWYHLENNPDHNLAVIYASNIGFEAKMRSDTGSYVISKLVEKIELNPDKFLYEIMDEIQDELESSGKQLPVYPFNNKTGYIKFLKKEPVDLSEDEQKAEKDDFDDDAFMIKLHKQLSKSNGYESVEDNDKIEMGDISLQSKKIDVETNDFLMKVKHIMENKDP